MRGDEDDIEKYLNRNQDSQNMRPESAEDVKEPKIEEKVQDDSSEFKK